MNRSVLIVTPYFAPQSHAAVFRAHKLAKYLPRFGWKPYVLTVDTNYLYNEDPGLLEELPLEVEIHRARYIEPTLRGLRMALGGKDRRFVTLKGRIRENCGLEPRNTGQGSAVQRFYQWLLRRYVAVPDRHRTWLGPAVRAGQTLIARHRIPLVYTSCLPYTSNRIGLSLQRSGIKWVADFRDPAGYAARMTSSEGRVALRQRAIVRETLERADAVTVLAPSYALVFEDMFPQVGRQKTHFIPTGLDQELLEPHDSSPVRPWPFLLFAGEYLPEYAETFFAALADAMRIQPVRDSQVRLLVVGHEILNRARLAPLLRRLGIQGMVEFMDHQPQRELYRIMRAAKACLLVPGETVHWWTSFAKLVDFIALRKPDIAVVPDPSVARSALTASRLGVFLDGDHGSRVRTLVDFLAGQMQTSAAG
jgi:glycosyltransferase involved in cell wall biosynthesis